jgi:hypothetical protein
MCHEIKMSRRCQSGFSAYRYFTFDNSKYIIYPRAHDQSGQKQGGTDKNGQRATVGPHPWELVIDGGAHHLGQPKLGTDAQDEEHGEEEEGPEGGQWHPTHCLEKGKNINIKIKFILSINKT